MAYTRAHMHNARPGADDAEAPRATLAPNWRTDGRTRAQLHVPALATAPVRANTHAPSSLSILYPLHAHRL